MKRPMGMLAAIGVLLAACAPGALTTTPATAENPSQETTVPTPLPDGPLAPEVASDTWLNTAPLAPADLRGKVVLIDFWTFG